MSTMSPARCPRSSFTLLEVVEVEHNERELPLVAPGAGDLALQRVVEGAAVVEAGEHVELGVLPGLGEASRGHERGPGATADALERVDRAVEEASARGAAQRCERTKRLVARPQRHNHPGPRAGRALGSVVEPVPIDDLDRADVRARGRLKGDPLRLLGRDPEGDGASLTTLVEHGERGVDAGQSGDLRERVREQFVGVEQRGELGARRPFAGDSPGLRGDAPFERSTHAQPVPDRQRERGERRDEDGQKDTHAAESLPAGRPTPGCGRKWLC